MSRTGQYLSHLKAYDGQILCMNTPSTRLLIVIFVAMRNRLPWQQRDISISQLSEGVEGPDFFIEVTADLKSISGYGCQGKSVAMATG